MDKFLKLSLDIPIIVEGKRDYNALRKIGFRGEIYCIGKKPLIDVCYKVAKNHRRVFLLFDFDKKGRYLYKKVKRILSELGVVTDDSLREFFKKFDIVEIEQIYFRIKNLIKNDKYFYFRYFRHIP